MSIANKIESMTTHIKNIYDTIDMSEINITDKNKNLENISYIIQKMYLDFMINGLNIVWDNWEKITAENTNISLAGTAYAPAKFELKANQLEQKTTTGKNLLNKNDFIAATSNTTIEILDTGIKIVNNASGYGAKIQIDNLKVNTNYYLSYNWINILNGVNKVVIFSGTGTSTQIVDIVDKNGATFNTGENTSINIWFYAKRPGEATVEYTDIQLEKGSIATSYESYTNGPSPNPDYPQDIHVISGNNEIVIESNLFSTEWEQGEIRATGVEASANTVIRTKGYIPVIPNQHYAINRNITGGYIQVRCYDKNKNYLGSGSNYITLIEGSSIGNPMNVNDIQCVIAPKDGVYYLRFNDFSNDLSTKYMMSRGDTQYNYQPYISQTYPINLPVKNLFDKDNATYVNYKILDDNGEEISAPGNGYFNSYISVKPNTQYTIQGILASPTNSMRIYYYDNSKNWISRTPSGLNQKSVPYTFTTPSGCYYIGFSYAISTYDADTIQIEEGIKANSYASYGTTPIEYCKIGDYEDKIFKNVVGNEYYDSTLELDKWYLRKIIGKVVLNGTENWSKSSRTTVNRYYAGVFVVISNSYRKDILSNNFTCITPNQSDNDNIGMAKWNYNGLMINFDLSDTNFDTLEKFKNYLSTHNTTVYYVQSSRNDPTNSFPTYTLLNDTLQTQLDNLAKAISYQDQTNVSQENNDLSFIINATVLKNITD